MFEALQDGLGSAPENASRARQAERIEHARRVKLVEKSLLEADVSFPVVRDFMQRVSDQAVGEKVLKSLNQQYDAISTDNHIRRLSDLRTFSPTAWSMRCMKSRTTGKLMSASSSDFSTSLSPLRYVPFAQLALPAQRFERGTETRLEVLRTCGGEVGGQRSEVGGQRQYRRTPISLSLRLAGAHPFSTRKSSVRSSLSLIHQNVQTRSTNGVGHVVDFEEDARRRAEINSNVLRPRLARFVRSQCQKLIDFLDRRIDRRSIGSTHPNLGQSIKSPIAANERCTLYRFREAIEDFRRREAFSFLPTTVEFFVGLARLPNDKPIGDTPNRTADADLPNRTIRLPAAGIQGREGLHLL